MSQQDADASEVFEAEEIDRVTLPTIGEPPVVEQPREQALDLPAPHVAAKDSAALEDRDLSAYAVRSATSCR